MSRLHNALVTAFNNKRILPKFIVFILEKDIMNQIKITKEDQDNNINLGKIYERISKFFVNQAERTISTFKECLPKKAIRDKYPHTIWIAPVEHVNFQDDNIDRQLFSKKLENEVKLHCDMSYLTFRQVWDRQDRKLCLPRSHKFSAEGLSTYWTAIDRTIKYCDTVQFKAPLETQQKNQARDSTVYTNRLHRDFDTTHDNNRRRHHFNQRPRGWRPYTWKRHRDANN